MFCVNSSWSCPKLAVIVKAVQWIDCGLVKRGIVGALIRIKGVSSFFFFSTFIGAHSASFEWLRGLSPFEIWRLVLETDNWTAPCEGLMKLSFYFPLRFICDMPRCLVSIPLFVIGVVCSWMLSRHPQIEFWSFHSGNSANHVLTYSNGSLIPAHQLLNFTEHHSYLIIS
jgi:hypothetical protein